MSRRKGEFEYRTSIFEGAYRAWSHLGGCSNQELNDSTAADIDPLTNPHDHTRNSSRNAFNETRYNSSLKKAGAGKDRDIDDDDDTSKPSDGKMKSDKDEDENSSAGKPYGIRATKDVDSVPYEPLPRIGVAHPFIEAILSPWLGPEAASEDIKHGVTTLRTWWQHRRKGASNSAKTAMDDPKMRAVIDGYTRHFFNLAYHFVVVEGCLPPRTLTENGFIPKRKEEEKKAKRRKIETSDEYESSTNANDAYLLNAIHTSDEKLSLVYRFSNYDIIIAMKVKGMHCDGCLHVIETALNKGVHGIESNIEGLVGAIIYFEANMLFLKVDDEKYVSQVSRDVKDLLEFYGYRVMQITKPVADVSVVLQPLLEIYDRPLVVSIKRRGNLKTKLLRWDMTACLCKNVGTNSIPDLLCSR